LRHILLVQSGQQKILLQVTSFTGMTHF
jgi:hypothetical protein